MVMTVGTTPLSESTDRIYKGNQSIFTQKNEYKTQVPDPFGRESAHSFPGPVGSMCATNEINTVLLVLLLY